ncbi:DNA-directed RNA polymerases iii 80 kda polypeptide RNA polymerase iii subunit 5 [Anaeramoeba ignava]|uniref:DNA-directed RNA polymerases iii 80 kDa polypeptide RNA polymerase iii subunit 5 n=1 Tax=Anaeramoeba ignava TaxID=1746090 RepID=A0A9Q0LDW6_ANAIG|nr:DNA-directed RNA polymerases iii 80 kda polypeptide RNA polymerase iii subunit 5 [Anaeramoeba ignava]
MKKSNNQNNKNINDDPITHEIPIYLNHQEDYGLYLFQFPMRSQKRGSPFNVPSFQLSMNPKTYNFTFETGKNEEENQKEKSSENQIGISLEKDKDKNKDEEMILESENQPKKENFKQISKEVPHQTKYFLGYFFDGEIHLNNVISTAQFFPDFSDLEDLLDTTDTQKSSGKDRDKEDANQDPQDDENEGDNEDDKLNQDENDPKKKNQNKFKDINAQYYRSSKGIHSTMNTEQENPDIPLHVVEDPSEKKEFFEKLFVKNEDHEIKSSLTTLQYMRMLNPKHKKFAPESQGADLLDSQSLDSPAVSEKLRLMTGEKQCVWILKREKIVTFSEMIKYATNATEEELLRYLNRYGVLINGCWVVRSELLPIRVKLAHYRNFLLDLLNISGGSISRQVFVNKTRLSPLETIELFRGLVVLRKGDVLKMIKPTDKDFLLNHKKIAKMEQEKWNKIIEKSKEFINQTTTYSLDSSQSKENEKNQKNQKNQKIQKIQKNGKGEKINQNDPLDSDNDNPLQDLDLVQNDNSDEKVKRARSKSKNESKHQAESQFKSFVVDLFKSKHRLKKQEILKNYEQKFQHKISDGQYKKVMKEIAKSEGTFWILKKEDQF